MRSLHRVWLTAALVTIVATSTTTFAHDGHDHSSGSSTGSNTYGSDRYPAPGYQPPSRTAPGAGSYPTYGPPTEGCAPGGCCSGSGACSMNAGNASIPRNDYRAVSTVDMSVPDELEQLALKMASVIQGEMQGTRDFGNLMADTGDVVRSAQRLRQSKSLNVSADVMLDEARVMLTPLKRMNSAVRDDPQARRSYQAVQDVGRLLVSWGRDLQSSVAGTAPVRQDYAAPSQNTGVSIPEEMKGVALLPANEQAAAMRQRTCPVIGEPLGSMGKPIRVDVSGRSVYVCCEGCVNALRRSPDKYLTSGNYGPTVPHRSLDQKPFPGPPPSSRSEGSAASIPEEMKGVALLPASEQAAAMRQRTCPVNGEPLGSMGKPIRVDVSGRSVYVCCAGCVNAVKRNPEKYIR